MIPLGVLASAYTAPASGGGSLAVTHLSNHSDSSRNAATRTFPGVSLGDAQDKTIIVVESNRVASGGSTGTITVAGYPATIDAKSPTHTAAMVGRVELPAAVTTGDIVVATGTSGHHSISVYVVYGSVAVVDADQTGPSTTATLSRTVDTATGGFAVASFSTSSGDKPAATWDGLAERYTHTTTSGFSTTADGTTDGSPLTVTATATLSGMYAGLVVVTYGPPA